MGSFDESDILFFLLWGGFIFFGMFSRKKKKTDIPEEQTEQPEQPSGERYPAKGDTFHQKTEQEYDFNELRKRILDSWGMKEEKKKPEEMDLPDEMEQAVYKEEDRTGKKIIRKKVIKTVIKKPKEEATGAIPARNPYQDYLHRSPRKRAVTAAIPVKEEAKGLKDIEKSWTEEDIRKWVVYDAVFGTPRSKSAWKPLAYRNEMNQ